MLKAVYDNYIDSHKHTHKLKHVKRQDENMPNTMSYCCFGDDFSFLNFLYTIIVISMDLEDQIILGSNPNFIIYCVTLSKLFYLSFKLPPL